MIDDRHTADDGTRYRDLNNNHAMDPFEDPRLPVAERVTDLVGRLNLAEKAGLMFHTVIESNPDGTVLDGPGKISKSGTADVVLGKLINHFNVHHLPGPAMSARWSNAVQRLAAQSPHGIPVTISSDPRHGWTNNVGAGFRAQDFSAWPEPLGLGGLGDAALVREYADTVRREYCAVGIRSALHPTADLATEPRWARQLGTFGADPVAVTEFTAAYLHGLQGDRLGSGSVAGTTKHFPGGGPQAGGEDPHFPYGRDQVYPGGHFADHLRPYPAAIAAGTAAIMPYYGRPVGLVIDGDPIEEVGFGYNKQLISGLLRGKLGYHGVVLTDWELINDNHVADQVLPARAWGVEHLDPLARMELLLEAGCDQFGGEECVDLLLELVTSGRVPEDRIDESAARLLTVKFQLGLFDDPWVDEDHAVAVLGDEAATRRGHEVQAWSTVVLTNGDVLPVSRDRRIYVEGIDEEVAVGFGEVVDDPADAELALVRIEAPFEPRDDLFLEASFHQGSLDFQPGLAVRLGRIAEQCPLILDITLDRAAVLTPLVGVATAMTGTFGVSDAAWLDAICGTIPPRGRLPIDLPSSMDDVRASREDERGTDQPLFRRGHGLGIGGAEGSAAQPG